MEKQSEQEEKTIPVFTVTKNEAILKNIFLLSSSTARKDGAGEEETLVVGRSPDCDITLSHPSISRFHLRLFSHPSSTALSVVDLSSVHGTCVMGKKIEPNVRVELKEGDALQLGGSSRVYKLHWVSLSQAYDTDNPFVSPADVYVRADKDKKGKLESDNGLQEYNRVPSLDYDSSEGSDDEASDEKLRLFLKNEIPSVPAYSEENADKIQRIGNTELEYRPISNSFSEQLATEYEPETQTLSWFDEILPEPEILQFSKDQKSIQKPINRELEKNLHFFEGSASLYPEEYIENPVMVNLSLFSETEIQQLDQESESQKEIMGTPPENKISLKEDQENRMGGTSIFSEKLVTEYEISPFPGKISLKTENKTTRKQDEEERMDGLETEHGISLFSSAILLDTRNQQFDEDQLSTKVLASENKTTTKQDQEKRMDGLETEHEISLLSSAILLDTGNQQIVEDKPSTKVLAHKEPSPEVKSQKIKKENETQEEYMGMSERADLMLETDLSNPKDVKNNEVTKSLFISIDAAEKDFTPVKENCTSNTSALNFTRYSSSSLERKEVSKNLFGDLNENNEDFTPDKENFTPNTFLMRSMVKMSKLKDVGSSILCISSSREHIVPGSVKKIPTTELLQERKLGRSSSRNQKYTKLKSGREKSSVKRDPFQSLFEHSPANKSYNVVGYAEVKVKGNVKNDKTKWCIVVDTTCLLNSESWRELQLLQGLKGTQLIIPRTVKRELDRLNTQGSLFRRMQASRALQWIEECMADTNRYIHVESSDEEPNFSGSRFDEVYRRLSGGGAAGLVFTVWENLFENICVSDEDHVLEYALKLRENGSDGKIVILSNDVTVKVKAMAEGLMCETADDFRESLVNPFSERFLFSDSAPRGLTWSCMDGIILNEYFYGNYMKLGRRGLSKGLKLILLPSTRDAHSSVTS